MKKTPKRVLFALFFTVVMALAPHSALAKMDCWPGGLSPWVDGHIYCMIEGSECQYCEVIVVTP